MIRRACSWAWSNPWQGTASLSVRLRGLAPCPRVWTSAKVVTNSRHSILRVRALSDGLALVFTLIEGPGLRQITARILHELTLRVRAAEAVSLALDSRIHGAIRLYILVVGETPATHIAEFPSGSIRGAKSNHECDRNQGGVNPRHRTSP
jgi:hypothetical protein